MIELYRGGTHAKNCALSTIPLYFFARIAGAGPRFKSDWAEDYDIFVSKR
jgi:hypothetical protein